MIFGNINHLALVPYLPAKLKEAILYVKENINNNTPVGRYDIDGDKIFLMLSDSTSRYIDDAFPEYHEKYIDIQIILKGPEGMAVSTLPAHTKVIEDKIKSDDIAFIETPKEETIFILQDNDFVVLYPHEVHKPLCAINNQITTIRKVVVKVALDSLF